MKLEFSLLVVDDSPDNVEQAIGILDDHLITKGFSLSKEIVTDFSEKYLKKLARTQGRNFDLVMVDYNLGQEELDGANAAHQLRQQLPYVDMVFYSSISVSELIEHLAPHEVSGVFTERREDLGHALVGLADTVIGKAVDLNHMRGIAMAKVAEMDVLMERTLIKVFQVDNEKIHAAKEKTIQKLRKDMDDNVDLLEELLGNGGLKTIVGNSRLFSLANKYQAIRRIAKCLPGERPEELQVLNSYDSEIIGNRNMLAHVNEESTENGVTILRSGGNNGNEEIIDEKWMENFRLKLQKHMAALNVICSCLDDQFG